MNEILISKNQQIQKNQFTKILTENSTVRVKILQNNGNGKYTGTVFGVKVNINSQTKLNIGQTFVAKVFYENGKLLLKPIINDNQQSQLITKNQNISNILFQLGIQNDEISQYLVKIFKQMEQKLDATKIIKFSKIAQKFGKNAKKISEFLAMFEQKNIVLNEENLFDLLNFQFSENTKEKVNTFNKKEGSWFLFPFEIILLNSNEKKLLTKGLFRILIEKNQNIKLLTFNFYYKNKTYIFNINFLQQKPCSINFWIENSKLNEKQKILQQLENVIKNIPIKIDKNLENSINACENETFLSFGGEI